MSGEIAALLSEPGALERVTTAFGQTIQDSFIADGSRRTTHETKRRFKILETGFRTMRRDLRWSVTKCIDELPSYLRCELEGADWKPEDRNLTAVKDRSIWLPGDGNVWNPGQGKIPGL